jgi:[ribosomal protein S5]-alanine N-acetyltransferase
MKHLQTERLLLKLYTPSDKDQLIRLLTDAEVMKHVDAGVLTQEKAEELWLRLIEDFYPQGVETIYAVFAKEGRRFVGHASIRPRPEQKKDWEIGYILRKEEWGKGFATEIARNLIDFGFNELNLPEIFATVDDDNFASIRVLKKVGMSFLRYEFDEQGRFSVYSIKK